MITPPATRYPRLLIVSAWFVLFMSLAILLPLSGVIILSIIGGWLVGLIGFLVSFQHPTRLIYVLPYCFVAGLALLVPLPWPVAWPGLVRLASSIGSWTLILIVLTSLAMYIRSRRRYAIR